MSQAGPLAYLALLLAFPASLAAFSIWSIERAALFVIFVSLLFLPSAVSMHVPSFDLDKHTIGIICILLAIAVKGRAQLKAARLGQPVDWLMLALALVPIGTTVTNGDALRYGRVTLPALGFQDAVGDISQMALGVSAPYLIGRVLFRTEEASKDLLRAMVLGAVIYVPFILVELRMSPQFHNWVYGYAPSDFIQAVRGDSYRPMVFTNHGLVLAMYMWGALVAAWVLWKLDATVFGFPARWAALLITLVFPLLKSFGALLYGLFCVPLAWFARPRNQIRIAALTACIVLVYPVYRAQDFFPRQLLVDLASEYGSPERAASLDFRLENEGALLDKALERVTFGWGGWGRGRVYMKEGQDASVTDGDWIIVLGGNGAFGFLAQFLLMLAPIFVALKRCPRASESEQRLLGAFSLLAAIRGLDLLPNSGPTLGMLFSGTLAGLAYSAGERARRPIDPRWLFMRLVELRRARDSRARVPTRSVPNA